MQPFTISHSHHNFLEIHSIRVEQAYRINSFFFYFKNFWLKAIQLVGSCAVLGILTPDQGSNSCPNKYL